MSQKGWIDPATGEETDYEQALAEAEAYGTWGGYPFEVLSGMYEQAQGHDRPEGVSVTQLLGCARSVHLSKLHEYYSDPASNYASFRGVIAHSMLEKFKPADAVVERRVWRTYRGIPISGQLDSTRLFIDGPANPKALMEEWLNWCDLAFKVESNPHSPADVPSPPALPRGARFLIRDWKSKDELPTYQYVAQKHQKQGNLYRWLLRIPVERVDIEFVYVSMKGVRIMKLYNGGKYANGRSKPEQVWPDSKVHEFLEDRLVTLALSQKLDKPLPYDRVPNDDLWNCQWCPAKELCYRLAADEAKASWAKGESVLRIPPRAMEKKS